MSAADWIDGTTREAPASSAMSTRRITPYMTKNQKEPSDEGLNYVRQRRLDHDAIIHGRLPRLPELYSGSPFAFDNIERDIQLWTDDVLMNPGWLRENETDAGIKAGMTARLLRRLRSTCAIDALDAVREALLPLDGSLAYESVNRLDVYLACHKDEPGRIRVARAIARHRFGSRDGIGYALRYAVSNALLRYDCSSMPEYLASGLRMLETVAADLDVYRSAVETVEAAALDDFTLPEIDMTAVLEDRAEIRPRPATMIVVPSLPEAGGSARKDIYKSWKGIDGTALPLVPRGDVATARRQLVEAWPHAAEVVDVILGDLAPRETVGFRPTLLVGEPGSGKTSLLRAICETVGLPVETYNLAGQADSSLGGTSSQWNSAREAVPLQLIKRAKSASVAVVWDEIEKAGDSRHNGSATDALLPLLEPAQAARFRDLALEVECDLSMVSHFATANSLDGIPSPLRDRMRVLTMPEPGWVHIHVLTRQIVARIAHERGIDPWYAPLAEDEVELMLAVWPGGSIRQLRRIVETMIDGRDAIIGRA